MKDLTEYLRGVRERLEKASPRSWKACHHLKSPEDDKSCPCGFPGDIWGADGEHVVCTMGPLAANTDGFHPPRYERQVEIANGQLIASAPSDLATLTEICEALMEKLELMNHALSNAQEWSISDPEDSEMDRDQQIDNWIEKAFDEARQAKVRVETIINKQKEMK